jgi:hypothetical protein
MPAYRLAFVWMAMAFAAAGCTAGGIGSLQSPLPPNPPDIAVVTKAAVEIFTKLKLPGGAEMSRLRPAHPSSLADWMFCLRSDADDLPRNYALFVRDDKISNYRLAVQIDECGREAFASVGERAP